MSMDLIADDYPLNEYRGLEISALSFWLFSALGSKLKQSRLNLHVFDREESVRG